LDCLYDGKFSRWFELSSSNSSHDPVDWNDYTKSCIWDLLHHIDATCKIKTDKNNTCKTCAMLITSPEFTSNLTGKTYYTKSFDPLDCSPKNVSYSVCVFYVNSSHSVCECHGEKIIAT
jgi:hypothetical protein